MIILSLLISLVAAQECKEICIIMLETCLKNCGGDVSVSVISSSKKTLTMTI